MESRLSLRIQQKMIALGSRNAVVLMLINSSWGLSQPACEEVARGVPETSLRFSQKSCMIHEIVTPENRPAHFISYGTAHEIWAWTLSRAPGCQRAGSREGSEPAGLGGRWQMHLGRVHKATPYFCWHCGRKRRSK